MARTLDEVFAALPEMKRLDLEQRGLQRLENYQRLQEKVQKAHITTEPDDHSSTKK
jgi:hypothetical protein